MNLVQGVVTPICTILTDVTGVTVWSWECGHRVTEGFLVCSRGQIEESENAGSRRESNPGHLARAASALPLSYDNRTTTSPHNPQNILHRWD